MKKFTTQTLLGVTTWIEQALKENKQLSFLVPNPDLANNKSLKTWLNLAELHFCKMLMPKIIDDEFIQINYQKLNHDNSFHSANVEKKEEKYGTDSIFFNINKNEEPTFLHAYKKALEAVKVETRKHVLNLGINKGDEFELIQQLVDENTFDAINFSGIDHSQSALEYAKKRFPKDNIKFSYSTTSTQKHAKLIKK